MWIHQLYLTNKSATCLWSLAHGPLFLLMGGRSFSLLGWLSEKIVSQSSGSFASRILLNLLQASWFLSWVLPACSFDCSHLLLSLSFLDSRFQMSTRSSTLVNDFGVTTDHCLYELDKLFSFFFERSVFKLMCGLILFRSSISKLSKSVVLCTSLSYHLTHRPGILLRSLVLDLRMVLATNFTGSSSQLSWFGCN